MDNIVKLSEVRTEGEPGPAPNQQQTAEHVASVSFELSEMVARGKMPLLKYLLDMTVEEAVKQGYRSRRRRTDTH